MVKRLLTIPDSAYGSAQFQKRKRAPYELVGLGKAVLRAAFALALIGGAAYAALRHAAGRAAPALKRLMALWRA